MRPFSKPIRNGLLVFLCLGVRNFIRGIRKRPNISRDITNIARPAMVIIIPEIMLLIVKMLPKRPAIPPRIV